jgi:hypothetical protein
MSSNSIVSLQAVGAQEQAEASPLKRLRKMELIALLEQERIALLLDRNARQLALPLMQQMGLFPNGIDLVCWLDAPGSHSNQAALTVWIRNQLDCPDFVLQTQSTPELVLLLDRLQARLARMEATFTS